MNIVFFGHFDVLVAVACAAAVHSLVCRWDGLSGTYLALGILLKGTSKNSSRQVATNLTR